MSVPGLPLQLTVPSDAKFRPIVLSTARRLAELVGLSAPEAAALRGELAEGMAVAVRRAAAPDGTPLAVTFEVHGPGGGTTLRVIARCGAAAWEVSRQLPGV